MKILINIIAVLAAIVGTMAVITGSRVLLGLFNPDYEYFTGLLVYNVIMGLVSIVTGVLIWKRNSNAYLISLIIAIAHIVVFILLITAFSDVISDHSVNAMTFRSVIWLIFSFVIWKGNSQLGKIKKLA